jgi:hypothetical protein
MAISGSGTGGPSMSRPDIDRALATLGARHAGLAAAMYAMDSHPAHTLLAGTPSGGATASTWADAKALMDELWVEFTAFGAALDQARAARARRARPGADDLATLAHLVAGPVLPAVPGAPHGLPLPEAAARLEAGCAAVTEAFDRVALAAAAVSARLAAVGATVAEIERLAVEVGDPPAGPPWRTDLAEVSVAAAADPIGAAADLAAARSGIERLAVAASATRDRLAAAAAVRASAPGRLAALAAEVRAVAAAEDAVRRSYAVAATTIADPGLPPAPAAADDLAARVDATARSVPAGSAALLRFGTGLDELDRAVDAARRRAAELREAADGLVERRAELRGRLDAYRVKGIRFGFAEHPDLTELHRTAHDLLYTRPCDLPAATRAVYGYQQRLATLTSQEERTAR